MKNLKKLVQFLSKFSTNVNQLFVFPIADVAHSMPVSQMGNYQEYLKRIPSPLREVESTPVRQHTFGNPFKIDKVSLRHSYGVSVVTIPDS